MERSQFQRVTAIDVFHFLVSKNFIFVPNSNSSTQFNLSQKNAIRTIQRWLVINGFQRGAKSGKIGLKPHIIAWRNKYFGRLLGNRTQNDESKLRGIYLDESYIHQHYVRHEDSIFDPNDEQDIQLKKPNKGRQICFLAALRYQCGKFFFWISY